MTVNKERVELLVEALESERYKQCKGYKRTKIDDEVWHCALGVATEVAVANGFIGAQEWITSELSHGLQHWYGFSHRDPRLLLDDGAWVTTTGLNDGLEMPFWGIAQAFRRTYLKDEG